MKSALVTGGAGFIGSHLVDRLLAEGWQVTAVDNFDPFYDRSIKERNVTTAREYGNYQLIEADIRDVNRLRTYLSGEYNVIVHLAAKAGVRPSVVDPLLYQDVNVRGTHILLELAREWGVKQFVFASSSSVYGVNPNVPWRETESVLQPISPYAATKVAGEILGYVYAHLYGIRFLALRFFTVYGPRQRPDLAIHKFARKILRGEPIPIYGDGNSRRDYTYVADIIAGIRAAMEYTATQYEVVNLGNNRTVSVNELVRALEKKLGIKAHVSYLPTQPGDVPVTWANVEKAAHLLRYQPSTSFCDGLEKFVQWFVSVYA